MINVTFGVDDLIVVLNSELGEWEQHHGDTMCYYDSSGNLVVVNNKFNDDRWLCLTYFLASALMGSQWATENLINVECHGSREEATFDNEDGYLLFSLRSGISCMKND